MSFFRGILVVGLSFYSFSSLKGMESFKKWWNPYKYSNSYFNYDLQKVLLLLMAKNDDPNAIEGLGRDEVLMITTKNYDLYCQELLSSTVKKSTLKQISKLPQTFKNAAEQEEFNKGQFEVVWKYPLTMINDEARLNEFYGDKIEVDDFTFITMNDEGRELFLKAVFAMPLINVNLKGQFQYLYPSDFISGIDEHVLEIRALRDLPSFNLSELKEICLKSSYLIDKGLMTKEDYDGILQIPINLRSKLGKVCTVKVRKKSLGDICKHVGCEAGIHLVVKMVASAGVPGYAAMGGAFQMARLEIMGYEIEEKPLAPEHEELIQLKKDIKFDLLRQNKKLMQQESRRLRLEGINLKNRE